MAGYEVMLSTIVQFLPKRQMSERRLSTVIEWPDHHCGDDLVICISQNIACKLQAREHADML